MECAHCRHDNRQGARFCDACGRPLTAQCADCGHELRPGARFCDACGAPVAAAQPPQADQRKQVTILFADLAGSTALQEQLDPESVRRLMGAWSSAMGAAIADHGGHIDHFAGDGVLAAWGVDRVREDDALRAVRAAWAMRTALADLNGELEARFGRRLRMRTGVHTGEVVVSSEGFLVGDTMNTAARLEQHAPEGEVLIGPVTRRLVRDLVQLEAVVPIEAKGKSEPLPAWRIVSLEAPAPAPVAPFVGRRRDLAALEAVFADAVAERRCRLAMVVGSPGLGKSRLGDELARRLTADARVARGACQAFAEGLTYLPVAEVLRDLAGLEDGDDVVAVLRGLVDEGDPESERVVDRLAALLGAGEARSAEETFWGIRRLLEQLARRRPLVILLDDLHWAESQFLDLVEHLVHWVQDAPVLLVGLTRPELREQRGALTRMGAGSSAATVVDLLPLGDDESHDLVDALVDGAALPVRVFDTAAGNPLFLGELVRMLVDDGALSRHDDGWTITDGAELDIPPTISALLTGRLERLPPDERDVVERASVIGRQFYRGAVAELAPPAIARRLDAHLETLRRKELIEPEGTYWVDEPVFRFHHVLLRDAAYRGLLKEDRAVLHERVAEWLERAAGERQGEQEELVAFHLEQAHDHRRALGTLDEQGRALGDRAAARLASAGRRALARDDFAAAANLLGRALRCASRPDALIRFDRCTALLGAGDLDGAAVEVAELERLATVDPRAEPFAGVCAVATAHLHAGSSHASQERLDRAIVALREGGEPRVLAHALSEKASFAVLAQGRHAFGQRLLEEALGAARIAGDERAVADVLSFLPLVGLWGPSPLSEADARCEEILRALRTTPGSRKMEAQTLCVQGLLEAMRGRPDTSARMLAAARATFEELALTLDLVDVDLFEARALLLAGRVIDAEACARRAFAGPGGLGVVARSLLAQALLDDDPDAALAEADTVLETVDADNLRPFVAGLSVRARVLARRGRPDGALRAARAAVEATAHTDAAVQRAEALEVLGEVLAAAGERAAAQDAWSGALEAFAAKEHEVGAQRVRRARAA